MVFDIGAEMPGDGKVTLCSYGRLGKGLQRLLALSVTAGGDIGMTELLIEHPPTYEPERAYIYDVMFGEFLGIAYQVRTGDDACTTVISVCGDSSRKRLVLHDVLFSTPYEKWLTEDSLPRQPLDKWVVPDAFRDTPKVSSEIPVIYGHRISKDLYHEECDADIRLGIDVFGGVFFMLTRYEEVVKSDRDEHDRFPAAASLAYQEGFLERPVVNEYLEVLWACMKRLWPGLARKRRQYRVLLSHDVDQPFAVIGSSPASIARNVVGDLIKRRDAGLALRRMLAFASLGLRREKLDPNATYDLIMDISDKYGLCSAFYFMAADQPTAFDNGYHIGGGHLRRLMKHIADRGHEIGFHASYNAFRDPTLTRSEFNRLRRVLDEEHIADMPIGGRQHYLRWEAPVTWRIWDELGLPYDSSVGFPYDPGFRAGTCYEYPVFDLLKRTKLEIIERPLTFMEVSMLTENCTVTDVYGLVERMGQFSYLCRRYNGDLCILWHNSNLRTARQKRLYDHVMTTVVNSQSGVP